MPGTDTAIHAGEVIARCRRAAGITQEILATHLGVTKAAVSKWELDQSAPDITQLPRIAAYFGITTDELLGYAEQMPEESRNRVLEELEQALSADFAKGFAACQKAERAHWRDWPFLVLMAALLINRTLQHSDHMEEGVTYLEGLLIRIEDECGDLSRANSARTLRASLMLMPHEPSRAEEGVALLESLENDHPASVASALAAAYDQANRPDDALRLRQCIVYTSGTNAVNECLNQMAHYRDDPQRVLALADAARNVSAALHLDAITPLFALTLHAQTAAACKNAGLTQESLEELEAFCATIDAMDMRPYSSRRLHEAPLFDEIADVLAMDEDAMRRNTGMSASLILDGIIGTILSGADWSDCEHDPRYQALLVRRGQSRETAARRTGQERERHAADAYAE